CICYVPISKDSLKKRGFNQCSVLAKNISSILDIPVIDCLVKVKETKEQKLLGKEERMKNILDAFEIKNKEKLFKKNILLIDDVYTTGATINECKKNIEKCNINKIYLLTIAKSNI
ncbi:ComF family protein, partial [Clostridium sp.]